MPLNVRRFNGWRLLKHFTGVSSGLSTHSSHWVSRSRNRKAGELSFEVAPACNNSIPQSIRHGNLISSHFFLAPHHLVFRSHLGLKLDPINIWGIREQRDTRDLAAEEPIWIKTMDLLQPFLLILCALHLTCKYCLLCSNLLLLWCVKRKLFTK